MNEQTKDVLIRAAKTFWQAALASVIAALGSGAIGIETFQDNTWIKVLVSIIIGAISSGLSAIYNGIIKPLLDKKKL